jgi:hypothetical protein
MSKDLVKWQPRELTSKRRPTPAESFEAKLRRWVAGPLARPIRPLPGADRPAARFAELQWAPPPAPPPVTTEQMLDCPRICAVTRKLWTARYRREAGERFFVYWRSTVAENRQCMVSYTPERYRSGGDFLWGIEDCPHCGGYTMDGFLGSVWCRRCRQWCCFGLTSRQGEFICQCGNRGRLVDYDGDHIAIA